MQKKASQNPLQTVDFLAGKCVICTYMQKFAQTLRDFSGPWKPSSMLVQLRNPDKMNFWSLFISWNILYGQNRYMQRYRVKLVNIDFPYIVRQKKKNLLLFIEINKKHS